MKQLTERTAYGINRGEAGAVRMRAMCLYKLVEKYGANLLPGGSVWSVAFCGLHGSAANSACRQDAIDLIASSPQQA